MNFATLIRTLDSYWEQQGCLVVPSYDMPVGAGTFHPATFLGALGTQSTASAYTQPSRRPTDGRYGENPNRLQRYFQYQVVIKPVPENIQNLYLDSLIALDIDMQANDVRFVEDNWESPALAATGLGWEVWLNGMEVTQFTYFQQMGGITCTPVMVELTYGLERLAMYLQKVDSVYDLVWGETAHAIVSYGDLLQDNEREQSHYNFRLANTDYLREAFIQAEAAHAQLCENALIMPAYEQLLIASHTFNLLDARNTLSVAQRQDHILRIRKLATKIAQLYTSQREE